MTLNLGTIIFCNAHFSNCYKINSPISIMSLELIAISEALSYAECLDQPKVIICSDSKSALQHIIGCASGCKGVSVAYKILSQLYKLSSKGIEIKMQWVPSHIGLTGNEEADKLAKKGILEGKQYIIKPYYAELLPKYRRKCHSIWKEYFNERSVEKGIWYKTIQAEPPHVPWFAYGNLSRTHIKSAHRLRTGHMPLKKFAYLMKLSETPNCETCGVVEDVHHLLVECVRFQQEREILETTHGLNTFDVGRFHKLLTEPASEAAKDLFGAVSRHK